LCLCDFVSFLLSHPRSSASCSSYPDVGFFKQNVLDFCRGRDNGPGYHLISPIPRGTDLTRPGSIRRGRRPVTGAPGGLYWPVRRSSRISGAANAAFSGAGLSRAGSCNPRPALCAIQQRLFPVSDFWCIEFIVTGFGGFIKTHAEREKVIRKSRTAGELILG
jgi:hypothetical protein